MNLENSNLNYEGGSHQQQQYGAFTSTSCHQGNGEANLSNVNTIDSYSELPLNVQQTNMFNQQYNLTNDQLLNNR